MQEDYLAKILSYHSSEQKKEWEEAWKIVQEEKLMRKLEEKRNWKTYREHQVILRKNKN